MANVKYQLNISDEQITALKKALHVGSPLDTALKFAGISKTTYYYMVAIASIVKYCREADLIKQQEEIAQSGISIAAVKESVQEENEANERYKATIDAFVEPSAESILKYRNNRAFHEYADKVYDIISECDRLRSEIVLYHLTAIRDSVNRRGTNSNASQWFLERTCPEHFGRRDNYESENDKMKKEVLPVQIEFIGADNKDSKDRVKQMEELVERQLGIETPKS